MLASSQITEILKDRNLQLGQRLRGGIVLTHIIEIHHGRYFPNTEILARLWAKGQRGGILHGYLMKQGFPRFEYAHPMIPPEVPGYYIYDGLRGCLIKVEIATNVVNKE